MTVRNRLAALALLVAAALAAVGQSGIPEEVRGTVNEGARLYRAGQYAEAQALFEQALRAAPSSDTIALFVARAIQQQYQPGVQTPENRAKGEEAIAAYERLRALDPSSEDAYKATVFLHGQLGNKEKVRELITRRAHDISLPPGQRAEAFIILASHQWVCSYDITERSKRTLKRGGQHVVRYQRPRDPADFERARRYAADGLALAAEAERLAPEHVHVWSYKANLLREAAKHAEMEGAAAARADYERRHAEALETHRRLSEELERRKQAQPQSEPHSPEP